MSKSVKDVMSKKLVMLEPDDSVAKANSIMEQYNLHSILIAPPEGGSLWRIFTETDVLRALNTGVDSHSIPIAEHASPISFVARPEWTCERALAEMVNRGVKHLPVVDGRGEVVGMISSADVRHNL